MVFPLASSHILELIHSLRRSPQVTTGPLFDGPDEAQLDEAYVAGVTASEEDQQDMNAAVAAAEVGDEATAVQMAAGYLGINKDEVAEAQSTALSFAAVNRHNLEEHEEEVDDNLEEDEEEVDTGESMMIAYPTMSDLVRTRHPATNRMRIPGGLASM